MYKPWKPSDDARLIKYAKAGMSAREAAKRLGRGYPATRYRAHIRKVRFNSVGNV
jgi:transposase